MTRRISFFAFYFAIAGIVFNLNNVDNDQDIIQRNTSPTKKKKKKKKNAGFAKTCPCNIRIFNFFSCKNLKFHWEK